MYKCGDHVVYGIHGVCRITEVEVRQVDHRQVRYYVLEPLSSAGSQYLVPMDNAAAVSKLHPIMSREELTAILCSASVRNAEWIQDENQRKLHYRSIVNAGDRAAMVQLIGSLYRHKNAQTAAGRKFRIGDENMLRDAEKLMNSEVSYILGVSPEQAGEYMRNALSENE